MRGGAANQAVTSAVRTHFDTDVADAIVNDKAMFAQVVSTFVASSLGADDIDEVIERVAQGTTDRTLDWLAQSADSPAGWLYNHL